MTESELLSLCDACLALGSDWSKLRQELDTLPAVQVAVAALCDSVAAVSMKFDRLEQSLQLCIDAREQHIAAEYTHKKETQLAKQRQQHESAHYTAHTHTQALSSSRAPSHGYCLSALC